MKQFYQTYQNSSIVPPLATQFQKVENKDKERRRSSG